MPEFKTPEQGAATSVWAATAPELEEHGGAYLEDCRGRAVRAPDRRGPCGGEHRRQVATPQDPAAAARLWAWSAQLTGVDAFAV